LFHQHWVNSTNFANFLGKQLPKKLISNNNNNNNNMKKKKEKTLVRNLPTFEQGN
jgi:hypothetical protein